MHIQRTTRRKNGEDVVERRLVSYGHIRHIEGADSVSVPHEQFEQAVLSHLSELSPSDLVRNTPTDDGLDDLHDLLVGIENRLRELEDILTDPKSTQKPATLTSAITRLEQQREDIRHQIHKVKKDREFVDPLGEVRTVIELLSDVSDEDIDDLRLRIRSKIADLIDEIIVKPEKHFGRVWVHVQVCYSERYSCSYKSFSFGPNFLSTGHRGIDLDSKNDCEKVIFAELAAQQSQASQVGFQDEVPDSVGEAGKAWLQHARSKMAKQSFRVVPSKIARFVEFMGADSGIGEIDNKRWNAWCDWLKEEIESGRLSFSTARVTYSRAREMVMWLGEQGRLTIFDSLSLSARLALS